MHLPSTSAVRTSPSDTTPRSHAFRVVRARLASTARPAAQQTGKNSSRAGSNYCNEPLSEASSDEDPAVADITNEVLYYESSKSTRLSGLPVGGRLHYFWQQWQALGASKMVVNWLRKGYPLPFHVDKRGLPILPVLTTVPPESFVTSYADPVKQNHLNVMINELLEKRAIVEVSHDMPAFFSRVFLIPKKNGKLRLIINLSSLNQWLVHTTFKMDHARVIREAIAPLLFATSIDLTDAYLHIPVAPKHWKYLVFQVGSRRFMFLVLPFGLSTAPRVFSEVMKVLKRWGRRTGLLLFQYLDDWLQAHHDASVLEQQTAMLVKKCLELGLLVNQKKSELAPQRHIVFLGDLLDFDSGMIFATEERFAAICAKVRAVTRQETAGFHQLHSLLGLLTATEKIVPYGRCHLRNLQSQVSALLRAKVKRRDRVVLTKDSLADLLWWIERDHVLQGVPMGERLPDLQVQTDASTTGWGVSCRGTVLHGSWSQNQQSRHINELEMMTVLLACEQLKALFQRKCILFLIDNQTVVSYVNKQGGTRSRPMLSLAQKLWQWAEDHQVMLMARHIRGSHNVVADLASRTGVVVNTEWSFTKSVFQNLVRLSPWGPPSIDLFANSLNHQLPLYFSPCPDDRAFAIDALTTPWPDKRVLYAFPPTTILDRVLKKILASRPSKLLLVAPKLLEAPWFPILQQMPCTSSWRLNLQPGDLMQPH